MASGAYVKFQAMVDEAEVLAAFASLANPHLADQAIVTQVCYKASVAAAVGCWEGYIEAVLREFVSKVRVQSHRKTWSLIAQFEALVDKLASELNTPSWEKARELILTVTGMDPFASWIWIPKFQNQNDTKNFFDGVLRVRHAFAHGFKIPHDVAGVAVAGELDAGFVEDAISCIRFFASKTDDLLAYELTHRHACNSGWS